MFCEETTAAFFHCFSSRTQMNCLISSKFDNKVEVSKAITFQSNMALYLSREIMFGFLKFFPPNFHETRTKVFAPCWLPGMAGSKAAADLLLTDLLRGLSVTCVLARQDQHRPVQNLRQPPQKALPGPHLFSLSMSVEVLFCNSPLHPACVPFRCFNHV